MSYTLHNNSQQKTIGILVVFAFHVALIFGLLNALGVHFVPITTHEPIQVTTIPDIKKPEKLIAPTEQNLGLSKPQDNKLITELPVFDIKSDIAPTDDGGPIGGVSDTALPQITKPKLIKASTPQYPTASIRLNEEGTTTMKLYIGENGRVAGAQVVLSSGSDRLDEAAIKHAERNWAFTPCTEAGKPVACWYQTKFAWRLEDARR